MNTSLLVALVTSTLGPIVTYVVTKAYERRFLEKVGTGRGKALTGTWEGQLHQDVGPQGPLNGSVELTLKAKQKTVEGTGVYKFRTSDQDRRADVVLSGGFFYERFLRLNYSNANDVTVQLGSLVVELNTQSEPHRLTGRFLGYGHVTEGLVYGSLDLAKAKT